MGWIPGLDRVIHGRPPSYPASALSEGSTANTVSFISTDAEYAGRKRTNYE
jgi:hypothetical protein